MLRLRDFHAIHYGEAMVVCGLGESINGLRDPGRFCTIGVNDIGRAFTPQYLFVMDAVRSFPAERFAYIRDSTARYIFTDHDLGLTRDNVVRFPIRASPRPRFDDRDALYLIGRPPTSPFLAVCLAAHMGAKAIGLIGVDFTNGHFFAPDGQHKLSGALTGIDARFHVLASALLGRGIKLFNLSDRSRICALPRVTPDEFHEIQRSGRMRAWSRPARRVLLESSARVNGDVGTLAKLINTRTTLSCRIVAPGSNDLPAGAVPDIERDVKARADVRIDCATAAIPSVRADDPAFLRTWHRDVRPLLFGRSVTLPLRDLLRRPRSVGVIVSQEHASGDEVAETVRSLWPDLLRADELLVLAGDRAHSAVPEWIRHSKRIRYVERIPGESFVHARNRAASLISTDILVFTDANVQAPRLWIDPIVQAFDAAAVAAVGPAIVDMYEHDSQGFGMRWVDDELNTAWLPPAAPQPHAVPLLSGAFLAVRRSVFEKVGGFDGGMRGGGGDDVELCFKLWTAGGECRVLPQLAVAWMNPYAAGAVDSDLYWSDLLHNLLRLASVHFEAKRLDAFVRRAARHGAFAQACARVLASDMAGYRQSIRRLRTRSDEWFFRRFAEP